MEMHCLYKNAVKKLVISDPLGLVGVQICEKFVFEGVSLYLYKYVHDTIVFINRTVW